MIFKFTGVKAVLAGLFILITVVFAYFIPREQIYLVFGAYAALFAIYGLWLKRADLSLKELFAIGFLARFAILFCFPWLSDDYFRFIWDGILTATGNSPFEYVPSDMAYHGGKTLDPYLLENMNSPKYYSIYPALCQYIFSAAVSVFPNNYFANVVVLKLFMLAFEIGSFFSIVKLLDHFKMDRLKSMIYWLNPLVIIELVGNIHFEAGMIFFVLFALLLLVKNQWLFSALVLSLAVNVKLIPLIFLPFIFIRIGLIKGIIYSVICLAATALLFLPLMNQAIWVNIQESVRLYFLKFEFNASIYYIIRWVGYQVEGYNIIYTAGKWLSRISFFGIIGIALAEILRTSEKGNRLLSSAKNLWSGLQAKVDLNSFVVFLFALFFYHLVATIVHPWYVVPLVAFSLFTKYRFALLWSALIPLSYWAYGNADYQENHVLIAIEYLVVLGYLGWELWRALSRESRVQSREN